MCSSSLPADYSDSDDAMYLTTVDTPVVGVTFAFFLSHSGLSLKLSEYPSPCKMRHGDKSTCVSQNSTLIKH